MLSLLRPLLFTSHVNIMFTSHVKSTFSIIAWSKIIDSSIIITDISDHLPILTWFDFTPLMVSNSSSYTTRLLNDQPTNTFQESLTQTNLDGVLNACQQETPIMPVTNLYLYTKMRIITYFRSR